MCKRFVLFLLTIAVFGCFIGCSTSTTSSEKDDEDQSSSSSSVFENEEFLYTYSFLHGYYYLAEKELKEPDFYLENQLNQEWAIKYLDVAAVRTMFSYMSDPFTNYYPHEHYSSIYSALYEAPTEKKSFGMLLDSTLRVTNVFKEGPARTAGLERGDVILGLDSTEFSADSAHSALYYYEKFLSDAESNTFTVTLLRNTDTLSKEITRAVVMSPSVYLDSTDEIPVIRITSFVTQTNGYEKDGTALEFEDALKETEGAKSTVIDMRGNGGGQISLCTWMAADLLFEGDTIIIEKDWYSEKGERDSSEYTYVAEEDGLGAGRYYVMLLDSGSASCTEIFATAITSNLNSPIVGTNSYGKGIGQTYVLTPDSAFASATSILFFDKNHETYHTHGLVPDYYIVDSDSALKKAVELAKGAKEKRTAGYGSDTQPTWRTASVKTKKLGKELSPSEAIKEVKRGGAFRILSGL